MAGPRIQLDPSRNTELYSLENGQRKMMTPQSPEVVNQVMGIYAQAKLSSQEFLAAVQKAIRDAQYKKGNDHDLRIEILADKVQIAFKRGTGSIDQYQPVEFGASQDIVKEEDKRAITTLHETAEISNATTPLKNSTMLEVATKAARLGKSFFTPPLGAAASTTESPPASESSPTPLEQKHFSERLRLSARFTRTRSHAQGALGGHTAVLLPPISASATSVDNDGNIATVVRFPYEIPGGPYRIKLDKPIAEKLPYNHFFDNPHPVYDGEGKPLMYNGVPVMLDGKIVHNARYESSENHLSFALYLAIMNNNQLGLLFPGNSSEKIYVAQGNINRAIEKLKQPTPPVKLPIPQATPAPEPEFEEEEEEEKTMSPRMSVEMTTFSSPTQNKELDEIAKRTELLTPETNRTGRPEFTKDFTQLELKQGIDIGIIGHPDQIPSGEYFIYRTFETTQFSPEYFRKNPKQVFVKDVVVIKKSKWWGLRTKTVKDTILVPLFTASGKPVMLDGTTLNTIPSDKPPFTPFIQFLDMKTGNRKTEKDSLSVPTLHPSNAYPPKYNPNDLQSLLEAEDLDIAPPKENSLQKKFYDPDLGIEEHAFPSLPRVQSAASSAAIIPDLLEPSNTTMGRIAARMEEREKAHLARMEQPNHIHRQIAEITDLPQEEAKPTILKQNLRTSDDNDLSDKPITEAILVFSNDELDALAASLPPEKRQEFDSIRETRFHLLKALSELEDGTILRSEKASEEDIAKHKALFFERILPEIKECNDQLTRIVTPSSSRWERLTDEKIDNLLADIQVSAQKTVAEAAAAAPIEKVVQAPVRTETPPPSLKEPHTIRKMVHMSGQPETGYHYYGSLKDWPEVYHTATGRKMEGVRIGSTQIPPANVEIEFWSWFRGRVHEEKIPLEDLKSDLRDNEKGKFYVLCPQWLQGETFETVNNWFKKGPAKVLEKDSGKALENNGTPVVYNGKNLSIQQPSPHAKEDAMRVEKQKKQLDRLEAAAKSKATFTLDERFVDGSDSDEES